jgi:hypothetical protein
MSAPQYPQQGWPPPTPPRKNNSNLVTWLACTAGVVVVAVIVLAISLNTGSAPTSRTATTSCTTALCEQVGNQPPTPAATTTTTQAPIPPTPTSFTLTVTILTQECFGSAGCDLTYRVTPQYTGPPTSGQWTITYTVAGTEDPTVGSFTYDADTGQAMINTQNAAQTKTSKVTLTATPTTVLPN